MMWRFNVTGKRVLDDRIVVLLKTFSYDRAMNCLVLYRHNFQDVYTEVVVEFPWWSFILTN